MLLLLINYRILRLTSTKLYIYSKLMICTFLVKWIRLTKERFQTMYRAQMTMLTTSAGLLLPGVQVRTVVMGQTLTSGIQVKQ